MIPTLLWTNFGLEKGDSEFGKLHYVGTKFHRIFPGFLAQGGDIQFRDDPILLGAGSGSIYGKFFDLEKQVDVRDCFFETQK